MGKKISQNLFFFLGKKSNQNLDSKMKKTKFTFLIHINDHYFVIIKL